MTTLLLIRHGRSTANASGVLAGRTEGVELDETGRRQIERLATSLDSNQIVASYTSPIRRCRQTANLLGLDAIVAPGLSECDYGEWTNKPLAELAELPLWRTVQTSPSQVQFPGGESMLQMQQRSVSAIREIVAAHQGQLVAVVSHGDPIKAILADALGMPFDRFQRIHVQPASVSAISYHGDSPVVWAMNAREFPGHSVPNPTVGGGDSPANTNASMSAG